MEQDLGLLDSSIETTTTDAEVTGGTTTGGSEVVAGTEAGVTAGSEGGSVEGGADASLAGTTGGDSPDLALGGTVEGGVTAGEVAGMVAGTVAGASAGVEGGTTGGTEELGGDTCDENCVCEEPTEGGMCVETTSEVSEPQKKDDDSCDQASLTSPIFMLIMFMAFFVKRLYSLSR